MSKNERYQPLKRPTQSRARVTFESILDAAARLLENEGYAALTTNHVAEVAGVSIGSLYEYFPDKDTVVAELARRTMGEMLRELGDGLDGVLALPLPELLREWVRIMFAVVKTRRRLLSILWREIPFVQELDEVRALNETLLIISRRGQNAMKNPISEPMVYVLTVMTAHLVLEGVVARPRHVTIQEIEESLVEILTTVLDRR